jgi:ankyrin repeat protein
MSDIEQSAEAYSLVSKPAELREFLADHPELKVDLYKGEKGRTSLHEASIGIKTASVSLLLDHKADINARDKDGDSSLALAVWNKREETALLLLERRADVHIKDSDGRDALHWSIYRDHKKAPTLVLLCCGADAKHVKISSFCNVSQAKVDAAIAEYNYTQDFIAKTHHVLKATLSTLAEVDTRVGRGENGIYHEPLERSLEYLGLSMNHDQVVNTSIDDTLRKRVLIPNQPLNAKHWLDHLQKERRWMKLGRELDAILKQRNANFP